MHKDANKIARAIDSAFAALRDEGFFAKALRAGGDTS
jgi:hypothetical protein